MAKGVKTGGRKKGVQNKRTLAIVVAAQNKGMLPHEFLCAVSQGQPIDGHIPSFEERLDAAKAAAPFYAPKLASTETKGESTVTVKDERDDIKREIAESLAPGQHRNGKDLVH